MIVTVAVYRAGVQLLAHRIAPAPCGDGYNALGIVLVVVAAQAVAQPRVLQCAMGNGASSQPSRPRSYGAAVGKAFPGAVLGVRPHRGSRSW